MTEKRLITADDLPQLATVDDPQWCADGQWVAYVRHTPSLSDNTTHTNLWLARADGTQTVQLTYSNKDSAPRWSPDGRTLAFVSVRGDTPQIYLLPLFEIGGEASALTQHVNGATMPVWSKDGTCIAYLARMNADERTAEDAGNLRQATADEKKAFFDPLTITRVPYRDGVTLHDDRYAQIYIQALDHTPPRRITHADAHYTQPEWSPDGTALYTTRIMMIGGDEYWRRANLFRIDVATGAETALLTGEHTLYDLCLSPDGAYLAFNRRDAADTISQFEYTCMTLATGACTVLNAALDRPFAPARWNAGGLFVAVQTEGTHAMYRVDLNGDAQPIVTDAQTIIGFDALSDGRLVLSVSTMLNPSELIVCAATTRTPLTQVNAAFLSSIQVQPAHDLWFESPGGAVQGWYILPTDYEEGRQYPLALHIHGGPQFMWGCHDRNMWQEWQLHAAQGYIVFFTNPRGSEGYGNAFNHGLQHDWGARVMEDVMGGVDALVATGMIDTTRMMITGGSFGGFAVVWMIAHTQRFRSAVAQRGVYNLISFYGTTDIPTFAQSQFDMLPWQDHAALWALSPLAHVGQIETPLLIVHSENDFRVPIEQGEQLFVWLHRMGKRVRLLRFPREGHELTRSGEPQHRVRLLNATLAWWAESMG